MSNIINDRRDTVFRIVRHMRSQVLWKSNKKIYIHNAVTTNHQQIKNTWSLSLCDIASVTLTLMKAPVDPVVATVTRHGIIIVICAGDINSELIARRSVLKSLIAPSNRWCSLTQMELRISASRPCILIGVCSAFYPHLFSRRFHLNNHVEWRQKCRWERSTYTEGSMRKRLSEFCPQPFSN
jgi:hypothetical protein